VAEINTKVFVTGEKHFFLCRNPLAKQWSRLSGETLTRLFEREFSFALKVENQKFAAR